MLIPGVQIEEEDLLIFSIEGIIDPSFKNPDKLGAFPPYAQIVRACKENLHPPGDVVDHALLGSHYGLSTGVGYILKGQIPQIHIVGISFTALKFFYNFGSYFFSEGNICHEPLDQGLLKSEFGIGDALQSPVTVWTHDHDHGAFTGFFGLWILPGKRDLLLRRVDTVVPIVLVHHLRFHLPFLKFLLACLI